MRAVLFLVLIALIAGGVYVAIYQPDWLFEQTKQVGEKVEEVRQEVAGFPYAKTPEEAMDKFKKAIAERDYKAAAKYCTGEYSEHLLKASDAAYEVGEKIDVLKNLMENKGLKTKKSWTLLWALDPFPALFERSKEKEVRPLTDKDGNEIDDEYVGWFVVPEPAEDYVTVPGVKLDLQIFSNALMPPNSPIRPELSNTPGLVYQVKIVAEDDGDDDGIWKLDIRLDPQTDKDIDHFLDNHKRYVNALETLIDECRRGSYPSGADFESELIDIFEKQHQSQ